MTTQSLLSDLHSGVVSVTNKFEQGVMGLKPFWQTDVDYKFGDVVRGALTDHREYVCSDTSENSEQYSQACSLWSPLDQTTGQAEANPWVLITASATISDPHAEAPVLDE